MQFSVLVVGQAPSRFQSTRSALAKGGLTNPVIGVPDATMSRAYIQGQEPYADRSVYPMPAVVVTDLRLPVGSGMDVLRQVRSHLTLRRTPIIVIADGTGETEIAEAERQGADAVLSHHIAAEVLLGVIRDTGIPWSVGRMETPA